MREVVTQMSELVEELMQEQYLHLLFGKPYTNREFYDYESFPVVGDLNAHPDFTFGGYRRTAEETEYQSACEELKKPRGLFDFFRPASYREEQQKIKNRVEELSRRRRTLPWGFPASPFDKGHADDYETYRALCDFAARVTGEQAGESYLFTLCYKDRTNDLRHPLTVYGLAIPNTKKAIVPQIIDEPEILIESFRQAYPGADNSKGTMHILDGENERVFGEI